MKQVVFDGRAHAEVIEKNLAERVRELQDNWGITPKLVSFLVGEPVGGKFYSELKKKVSARIGAKFELRFFDEITSEDLIKEIKKANKDKKVHGVMIQMPLPAEISKSVVNKITKGKDVDGLCNDSEFVHPTVRAILDIVDVCTLKNNPKIVVVGARGMVGSSVTGELEKLNYKVKGIDKDDDLGVLKDADVVISATGEFGIIKGDMLRKGMALIDVGYPKGDMDESALKKASFYTPVPGGVGPVTISYLLENLVEAAYNTINNTHLSGAS